MSEDKDQATPSTGSGTDHASGDDSPTLPRHEAEPAKRDGAEPGAAKPTGDEKADEANPDGENGDATGEDHAAEKPSLFKRPLFWIILIVILAVAITGGVLYWLHARQFESTDDAFVDAHIVRLTPQVSGRLEFVADKDNRHVLPGVLLARIEPSGPQASRAEAQAAVGEADAQIAQAQGQVVVSRAQRAQAIANARTPEADAIKAEQDLARYRALLRLDPSAVAGTQLDQAVANLRRTAAQAAAARREIDTAEANITVARKGITAAQAQRRSAQSRVASSDVTVGNLRVVAPIAGQVVNRTVNVGSYVSPQTQMMAVIPDTIWITANFKETQLALMRLGQSVTIKVDAFPDVSFEGRVASIQRGAGQAFALLPPQNATGNYVKVVQRVPVRIEFLLGGGRPDPRQYALGPGMSVVPTVKVR